MKSHFWAQFAAADKTTWQAQVQKELRGAAPFESLRWQPEGPGQTGSFSLEPYYTSADLTALPLQSIQAAQKKNPGWLNAPAYTLTNDPKTDNLTLRDAIERGAEAFILTGADVPDFPRLLNGIKLSDTPVYFRTQADASTWLLPLRVVTPYQLRGGILSETDSVSVESWQLTADSPHFCPISVNGHRFHNAGATPTQELAFMLASLADQYDTLTNAGLAVEQLRAKTMFSVSVGTSYFMEIAKLRALRVVWQRFLAAYKALAPAVILAQTSTFYNARQSPYTNLLRATTEALAAVVGGCDVLSVTPYNTLLGGSEGPHADYDFGQRIARNVSILVKEESYLDKVADPSAGSYYIEMLTHELAEAAWALFLRVEAMGGLANAKDFVKAEIDAAYRAKVEALNQERVMVGVNKFQEADDFARRILKTEQEEVDWLPNRRVAEAFE